jgi:cytochrome c biogenesis protein CcmG/thiol:disulfide interchange protein DsbE
MSRTEIEAEQGFEAAAPRRPRKRLLIVLVVLAAVAGGALAAVQTLAGRSPQDAFVADGAVDQPQRLAPLSGAEGFPLPDTVLPGFDGAPDVPLAAYRGEPLLVNFFASWCAPCVREMPMLEQLSHEAQGQVAFLGVNLQDAPSRARVLIADVGTTYDLASDPTGDFFREVRGIGMPTTLFVDPEGTVRYRHTGEMSAEQLRDLLRTHLGAQL